MARKQIKGQMSLFDYINSIQTTESFGKMEMTSLMPEFESKEPDAPCENEEFSNISVEHLVQYEELSTINKETLQVSEIEKPKIEEDDRKPSIEPLQETKIEIAEDGENGEEGENDEDDDVLVYHMSKDQKPVMSKYFKDDKGRDAYVEYRNYNRIIICMPDRETVDIHFDTSQEAVNYYIEQMIKMSESIGLHEIREEGSL